MNLFLILVASILSMGSFAHAFYPQERISLDYPEENSEEITVAVKFLTGLTLNIPISPDASVYELKEMIEESTGVPIEDQRIIFAGKMLQDEKTLSEYPIFDGSTLYVVLKLHRAD